MTFSLIVFVCCSILAGIVSFVEGIKRRSVRIALYIIFSLIAIIATYCDDQIAKKEAKLQKGKERIQTDSIRKKDRAERDSLVRIVDKRDSTILSLLTYSLPIRSIRVQSTNEGVMVSYYLTKKIKGLKFQYSVEVLDRSFSVGFGEGISKSNSLPSQLGDNSIILDKIMVGKAIKFQIKGDDPHIKTPIMLLDSASSVSIDNQEIITQVLE